MGGFDPTSVLNFLKAQGGDSSGYNQPQSDPLTSAMMQPQQATPPQQASPQQQQPQQNHQLTGIKGYLSNILYNMGEAAKVHLGMPTDVQVQQNQRKLDLQQRATDQEFDIKNRQLQMQAQMVTLPNGMSVPFGLAKPYIEAWGKQQAVASGKRFMVVPNIGMVDTQAPGGPSIVPGTQAGGVTVTKDIAGQYNIPEQLIGKTIPIQQFAQMERGGAMWAQTVTNGVETKELADGTLVQVPKPSTTQKVSPNAPTKATPQAPASPGQPAATGKPVGLATRGGVKTLVGPDGQPLQGKTSTQIVYALDPQTHQTVSTTRADATTRGLQITTNNVGPAQVRKDQALSNRLADVQRKVGDYADSFSEPIDSADEKAIAYLMSNDTLGKLPIGMPLQGFAQNLLQSAGMNKLSDPGMKRLILYNQARESLSGYQQILTNSGHSSDTILNLQLSQLPSPISPTDFANMSTGEFQKNIDLAGQGIPVFQGIGENQQAVKAEQMQRRAQRQAIQSNFNRGAVAQTQGQTRPPNVPGNYVYKVNGPKGTGWYKP